MNILFTLYVDCNCCLEVIILPTVFPRVIHIIHIITTNYALKKYADLAKMDGMNTQFPISMELRFTTLGISFVRYLNKL